MSNPIKWLDRDEGPVNYGEPTYWDRRYELDKKEFGSSYRHDWYFDHDKLKATFESYFGQPRGQRILVVGCGLSTIASQMHAVGYRCITAIDISPIAITLMQAGDQDKEGVEYMIGDARKMDSLPDNLFDGVFDKGCADSLICGYRSTDDVVDMFRECCRVLRPEGVFLCVSHGPPDARMHMFKYEGLQWLTNVIPMHGSEGLNVYVSTKWTQHEIEASERQRLDDIESTLSMRTSSSFSQSKSLSRQGVMHENRIVHAMAPHELDELEQRRKKEAAEQKCAKEAARAEAKAAAAARAAAKAAATTTGRAMVPVEAPEPCSTQSGGSIRKVTATASTGPTVSSEQGDETSVPSILQTAGAESPSGAPKGGGFSTVESGSLPTGLSSITTRSGDLPANVIASG